MPNLTAKFKNSTKLVSDISQAVKEMLMKIYPDMYVKVMGGDITVTPLLPVGDKLRFVIELQITPDNRKKKEA